MQPSPRSDFLDFQDQWLAPFATREPDAASRRHPEPEHHYRSAFQRDRDRIIHCSAFRRLDYKTQVFVPHERDHFRTRLTHTLEVAQVARSLARALRLNEDLAEAAALAHDLGHPPFGHGGEAALADLMTQHGHFEHNRQSLRIVDYLEHPYPNFRGLNLTAAVRECLAKHTTRYDSPLDEEFAAFPQACIEGQIVDAADEIAYTSADLSDALEAAWLSPQKLSDLTLWQLAWQRADASYPDAREIHKQIQAAKAVLAILADDLISNTLANIATMNINSPDAARHAATKCVAFSPNIAAAAAQMQDFLLREVYTNEVGLAKDAHGRRIINDLFNLFTDRPQLLPPRYQSRIDRDGLHRVACDYIAGMTDRFCKQEHQRLIG